MKFWIQAFNAGTFWVPDLLIQCRLRISESTPTGVGCSHGIRVAFWRERGLGTTATGAGLRGRASTAGELQPMKACYPCGGFTLQ
jgi:hypothetical protein